MYVVYLASGWILNSLPRHPWNMGAFSREALGQHRAGSRLVRCVLKIELVELCLQQFLVGQLRLVLGDQGGG
jgi:hypothetical protein